MSSLPTTPLTAEEYRLGADEKLDAKQYKEAIADHELAFTLDPQNSNAKSNIAFIQFDPGDLSGAISNWQAALTLDSQNTNPRMALAPALYKAGQKEQALAQHRSQFPLKPPSQNSASAPVATASGLAPKLAPSKAR